MSAAIIGAGPAGCVAAIMLGRAGWRVDLIEQQRFPRDKVCGECLSALGIEVLRRLGVRDDELRGTTLKTVILHAPDSSTIEMHLPRPMLGISRSRLDWRLLETARASGVRVRQPARCERIEGFGELRAEVRDLASNCIDVVTPDWLLLAEGKGAMLPDRAPSTEYFGIKAHFQGINGPLDAIELFGVHGCYGGLAPIEDGRWNAACSVPRARIQQHHGDIERVFDEMIHENRALEHRMRTARRVGDWLVAPLPRFGVRRRWPDRVIPLGNAAAAIEPIGGEGMGLAMRSAELAAQMLLDSHRAASEPDLRQLHSQFKQLWQTRRFACRVAGIAISSCRLMNFTLPALDGREPLIRWALQIAGKAVECDHEPSSHPARFV